MNNKSQLLHVSPVGQTDVGLVRKNNEDSFLIADLTGGAERINDLPLNHVVGERGSLFMVADGMGGAQAGEVASRMAIEVVSRHLKKSKFHDRQTFVRVLKQSIEHANSIIYHESHRDEGRRGMGTTLTAAGVYDGAVFFAQVGDSRAYVARNNSIVQMTQDQSFVAHLIASGILSPGEAKKHPQRNVILQALGVQEHVEVALSFVELKRRDWVILCSDGLSANVEAEELKAVLGECSGPQDACRQMIALARERGGEDNITVIIARFDGERLSFPLPEELPIYQEFNEKDTGHYRPWRRR